MLLSSASATPAGGPTPPVRLTPTERRILDLLRSTPGQPWTRAALVAKAMNGAVVLERTIDVHIRSLRHKLGPAGSCIQTVRRIGYRWFNEQAADRLG